MMEAAQENEEKESKGTSNRLSESRVKINWSYEVSNSGCSYDAHFIWSCEDYEELL